MSRIWLLPLCLAMILSGCADNSSVALVTLREALWGQSASIDSGKLDPRFRYLRLTQDGRVLVLALGEVETGPAGPVEVWFSASREVLRMQQGRVAGLSGVYAEWHRVQWPSGFPEWTSILERNSDVGFERMRDVMPGYRFGVRDRLRIRPVAAPAQSALTGIAPQTLRWFEEIMVSTTDQEQLPPARYALSLQDGEVQVVYGEQCISAKLCFTWQRWTAGQ